MNVSIIWLAVFNVYIEHINKQSVYNNVYMHVYAFGYMPSNNGYEQCSKVHDRCNR